MKDRGRLLRAVPARPLLAFVVDDKGEDEFHFSALVYAFTAGEAWDLARRFSYALANSLAHPIDWNVERQPSCDGYADRPRVAQWAKDERAERDAGFREEDAAVCEACEKGDTSGREWHPEWALCEDCGRCGACGHDMLCSETSPALAARMAKRALRRHVRKTRGQEDPSGCFRSHERWLRVTIDRLTLEARNERISRAARQPLNRDPLEEARRAADEIAAAPEPSRQAVAEQLGESVGVVVKRRLAEALRGRDLAREIFSKASRSTKGIDLTQVPVRGFRPEAIEAVERLWHESEGRATGAPYPDITPQVKLEKFEQTEES